MFQLLEEKGIDKKLAREMVLYLIIGGGAVIIELIIFTLIFNLSNVNAVPSNVIANVVSTTYSFILNSRYNFRKTDQVAKRMTTFFIISAIGFIAGTIIIYVMTDLMGINGNISKLVSLPVVVSIQFVLNKFITFK